MLNLLIVDDEQFTRETIKECISWGELGIDNVRTAKNGLNALEVIKDYPPDILLCDVRMPKMNGIELAFKLRELHPECKIIFISGHADKEYLKSAIQLRAVNYIEKPFSVNELSSVLKDAVSQYMQEVNQRHEYEALKKNLDENTYLILQDLVLEMVNSNSNSATLADKLKDYNLNWPLRGFYTCASVAFNKQNKDSNNGIQHFKKEVLKVIYNELFIDTNFIAGFNRDDTLILVSSCTSKPTFDYLQSIYSDTLKTLSQKLGKEHTATIGIGSTVDSLELLSETYLKSQKALLKQFYLGENKIYLPEEDEVSNFEIHSNLYNNFKELVEKGKISEAADYIKLLTKKIMNAQDKNIDYIKNIYFSLLLIIFETARKNNLIDQMGNNEKSFIWKEIEEIKFLSSLCDYVIHNLNSIFSPVDEKDSVRKKIYEIKNYIYAHYADKDLSTHSIAMNVYLSQTYMCSFFKKNTGETLNDFITKIRMEKAKDLLKDNRIKLLEVAGSIGFSDVNYFSTLFKKQTGMTPSEYRGKTLNV